MASIFDEIFQIFLDDAARKIDICRDVAMSARDSSCGRRTQPRRRPAAMPRRAEQYVYAASPPQDCRRRLL